MAVIQIGDKLTARELNYSVSRAYSTGVGSPTIASGASIRATFNNIDSYDDYITWSGPNTSGTPSRMTFTVGGDYEYGFSWRGNNSTAVAAKGNVFLFVYMNDNTAILGEAVQAVLAANVYYVVTASEVRAFSAGDYIEVRVLNNGLGQSLFQAPIDEVVHFWAKRTIGPS